MDGQRLTLLPISMSPGQPMVSVAPGTLDGAVAELQHHEDGIVTAEIRIPGPPVP